MFNGIQPRKYREVLSCLNATVREYPRGAHIVELGEQSHNTGVLLDGTIEEFLYAITKKTISYFEGILGMTLAVLCVITLRFAIWEPELLQKIFLTIFG